MFLKPFIMKTTAKKCLATLLFFVAAQISVFAENNEQGESAFANWSSYVLPFAAVAFILLFTWLSSRGKPGNKKHA